MEKYADYLFENILNLPQVYDIIYPTGDFLCEGMRILSVLFS